MQSSKKAFVADMTTNGFLLNIETAKKLYKLHVYKYQITLDGTSQTHNKQRILRGGGKTFDTITKNLLDIKNNLRRKFLEITIRTNLTNEIITTSIVDYINFLKENFANDEMFDLRFRVAWEYNNTSQNTNNFFITSEADAYKYVFSLLYNVDGLNFSGEMAGLLPGGGMCYAAKNNEYVIGSDGMIYKCTVHFDDDKNQLGYISKNGELVIDQEKLAFWTKSTELCDSCNVCTSKLSCLGLGCPYNKTGTPCNAINFQNDLIITLLAKNQSGEAVDMI